ncbi:MAG: ArsR/SmtB family transcription factor [Promethearchaeota archaeon]
MDDKDENLLERLSSIFKALSDSTRLKIFRLLMFNDEDKMRVIDLAAKIGISQPAATQHINILKEQDLVKSKKDHNRVYYYIDREHFEKLKHILFNALDVVYLRCTFKGKCEECPRNRVNKSKTSCS